MEHRYSRRYCISHHRGKSQNNYVIVNVHFVLSWTQWSLHINLINQLDCFRFLSFAESTAKCQVFSWKPFSSSFIVRLRRTIVLLSCWRITFIRYKNCVELIITNGISRFCFGESQSFSFISPHPHPLSVKTIITRTIWRRLMYGKMVSRWRLLKSSWNSV